MLGLLRQHRPFFVATTLASLALRLFFFFHFPAITDDSRVYADFATNLLQHGIYGRTVNDHIIPADSRLPGYPLFLAAVFSLFGVGNFRAVLLLQIALDLVTCLAIADLARRTISNRAAPIAYLLAGLCPFLANYSAAALTETLEILFTAIALDCAVAGLESLNSPRDVPRIDPSASPAPPVPPAAKTFSRDSRNSTKRNSFPWIATGLSIGAAILLRPDGGILLASLGAYLLLILIKKRNQKRPIFTAGIITLLSTIVVLAPWTIRNFRTLHRFQPLAPRYATEQDELAPRGFNRWVRTWIAEYTSVEEIYWDVPGNPIDPTKLPNRAFDSPEQKEKTLALIADYNAQPDLTPELDHRFAALADERIRNHPLRYYAELPLLRIADMWLRPRTELLPPDPRWWEFNDLLSSSITAIVLGLLNLAYIAAAAFAILSQARQRLLAPLPHQPYNRSPEQSRSSEAMQPEPRHPEQAPGSKATPPEPCHPERFRGSEAPEDESKDPCVLKNHPAAPARSPQPVSESRSQRLWIDNGTLPAITGIALFLLFVALRSAFLGTLENPEPRYTLECYPVVILLAAAALDRRNSSTKM